MTTESLIAGRYAVDPTRPVADAGGGVPAFTCQDMRAGGSPVIALRVQPGRPPRADALDALMGRTVAGVLAPLAHGAVGEAYYVVCSAPPGPSLAGPTRAPRQAWAERDILEHFLRPAAQALAGLGALGITHRAINLDNLFRAGPGMAVILGTAWAAPPASLQPSVYEPPYVGQCFPVGRGNGGGADDVYALGVAMIALATGRLPLAGLPEAEILRQKLDVGSFQALAGNERLPAIIGDLARGMLAEDPAHRPLPEMLIDPAVARARRVAARPPRRASRVLEVGRTEVANARGLAWVLGRDPAIGVAALREGRVEHWLRRGLGDATLAGQIEEATRVRAAQQAGDTRADGLLLARAVAVLDPLAPLCWSGLLLWPDGIGAVLADGAADPSIVRRLSELIDTEFLGPWSAIRTSRTESAREIDEHFLRREAHRIRAIVHGGGRRPVPEADDDGLIRLRYQLNPLLPCASPLLAGHWVADLKSLLPALEIAAKRPELARGPVYDREIAAFVAARTTRRDEREATARFPASQADVLARTQIWLYASLQSRWHGGTAMPGLAGWLVAQSGPLIENWESRPQRQAIAQLLAEHAPAGQLVPLLAILEDPATRAADENGVMEAVTAVARIDATLRELADGGAARADMARRLGQELAAGAGLVGMAGILTSLVLG